MIKHGTVRADGKMFWGYHKHAKNGEEWCTPSAFIRRKSKSRARQWMNRRRRTHWLNKYKQHQGCCYCGYDDDGIALQFHHTGDKAFNVSDARSYSLRKLFSEIRKCVVICSNCHAIETTRLQQARGKL